MSWSSFVSKCRHFFTNVNVSPPPAGPVAVVCNCPNCGHVAMTVFLATPDRIEAVKMADRATKAPREERNGTSAEGDYAEKLLQERKERREEANKRPRSRIYDTDQRNAPDV